LNSLRIGCVKYLNARPLIYGWPGPVTFDHPAALCAQLANGDLDVALVSSFEFLRNPIYRVVDDVSISSAGSVYSVVVAHHSDISEVEEIELDPASETSSNLLRCLLGELELNPRLIRGVLGSTESCPERSRLGSQRVMSGSLQDTKVQLLIGDQAIRFRQEYGEQFRFWDLGEQWNKLVGLPFVYALWLIRPEIRDLKPLAERLRKLRDENLADIDKLIAEEKEFDHDFCRRYYRENLRFDFAEKEREGLREFHKRSIELRLLPEKHLDPGAWDLELPLRCL
jgi:chorismate dehydratase